MRALLVFTLLAFVAPDRENPTPKDKAKPIQEQVLGDWQLVKAVMGADANPRKEFGATILTFTAGEIQIQENGKRQDRDDAGYTLDVKKMPTAIDIIPKRGGDKTIQGILKLEGDQLTLCFTHGGNGDRPLDFVSPPNTQIALMHFKRVKK